MSDPVGYKPVPVEAARVLAASYEKDIVIVVSIDWARDRMHITTYGREPADKIKAGRFGEMIDAALDCGGQDQVYEDFRTVDAAKRAKKIEGLVVAGRELLALIDEVGIDPNLGDETDRVFPRYEFDRLRAAVAEAEKKD